MASHPEAPKNLIQSTHSSSLLIIVIVIILHLPLALSNNNKNKPRSNLTSPRIDE